MVALLVSTTAVTATFAAQTNGHTTPPAPLLFADAAVAPLSRELAAQKLTADADFTAWAASHPSNDEAAFTSFALNRLPPPPGPNVQAAELSDLRTLAATRTKEGMWAADWLEAYGKTAIWQQYVHDALETASPARAAHVENSFMADLKIAERLAQITEAHFARRSPSAVEPSLRRHARPAKLSYPSAHAVFVYTELQILTTLDPGRAADFTRMANQVSYSRLYAAGHYRSDLIAGAYLGDLLGDYAIRALNSPQPPPEPGSATDN